MHKMIWPGAAAAILAMSAMAGAQSMSSGQQMSGSMANDAMAKAAMAKPASYTGCLAKGDTPDTFVLNTETMAPLALSSKDVKLEKHVGEKVTVTGPAHEMSGDHAMPMDGMAKDGMAPFVVKTIKTLSAHCS